jgi:ubiquitin-activating enzyme E1
MVTFRGLKGAEELNGCVPCPVRIIDPFSFSIGDTLGMSPHQDGGEFVQIKPTKGIHFKSLEESICSPDFVISDFAKMDRHETTHIGFLSLFQYTNLYGRFPAPQQQDDAEKLIQLAKEVLKQNPNLIHKEEDLKEDLLKQLAFGSSGYLPAMAAVAGGLVAQEALKVEPSLLCANCILVSFCCF